MFKRILICCCLLLSASLAFAQFRMENARRHSVEIPFEFESNFIVLEIVFNRVFPLKFILDTGAEHTILTKRSYADILDLPYRKRFSIMGADMQTVIFANLISGVHMDLGGVQSLNHSMLVLEDDYFNFEKLIGTEVHGIIGADLLRHFVMKIDYRRKVITFTNPKHFKKPGRKFREFPIELNRNKPYVINPITLENGAVVKAKLLIDTGASLALLINTNTHPDLVLPENVIVGNIGTGLGGFLEGFMGRVKSFELAGFEMENVIVNFQDVSNSIADTTISNSRNGILGNTILSRFTLITDYHSRRIFVRPVRRLNRRKFYYDRSGMAIVASGRNLDSYVVNSIMSGSPAEEAGLLPGDLIRSINGIPTSLMSLQSILGQMQRRAGRRVRVTIIRDGKKIKKEFRLRELI
ncbi:MAG: aspartyl protease family protein [Bacteroidota bacterium]